MDESFAASAAGEVLDASAVAAWGSGHLGMQTWFGIAWELQLSFSLPAFARNEATLLHPATEPLIETVARAPYVVLADLGTAEAAAIDTRQQAAGVFDPLAGWVVHACRQRGWPAISTDPGRLRRIDLDLPIQPVVDVDPVGSDAECGEGVALRGEVLRAGGDAA